MDLDDLIRKIQAGEINSSGEVLVAIKLLMNKEGTNIEEIKEKLISDVEYASDKIEHNGKMYVSIDSIKELLRD